MKERELLFTITKKDYEITWFSGKGGGGQHRNKHQNCCRLKHIETGIITTGQSNREQRANLKEAFNSMCKNKKFLDFIKRKSSQVLADYDEINKSVDNSLREENLKIEYF